MSQSERSSRRYPFTRHQSVAMVLLILSAVFIIENRRTATIRFLVPQVAAPLWLALFVAMMLGVGVGALLARQRLR